jgi:hypothetical protein
MPKGPTITANPLLTSYANGLYTQDLVKQFAGLALMPAFHTSQKSASYYKVDRESLLSLPEKITRAPGDTFARSIMKLADDSFACRDYGIEEPVDDGERAVYSTEAGSDYAAILRVTHIVAYNHELRVKAKCATMTQTAAVGTQWDDSGATPITDVKDAAAVIHAATGLSPNVLVIPKRVYDVLTETASILDRIKYVDSSSITEEILARLFGVQKVVVAGGIHNTAAEGQALNPGYIWGADCYLAVAVTSQDLKAPTFGRTFIWGGPDAARAGAETVVGIGTYRDETRASDVHRARQWADEKIVGMELGYRLSACI